MTLVVLELALRRERGWARSPSVPGESEGTSRTWTEGGGDEGGKMGIRRSKGSAVLAVTGTDVVTEAGCDL
jgi:hypothetical protein